MNDKFVDMPKCMADKYETADFIASDPVQFPRRYSGRDAEVSGFITSWALVRESKGDHRGGGDEEMS